MKNIEKGVYSTKREIYLSYLYGSKSASFE